MRPKHIVLIAFLLYAFTTACAFYAHYDMMNNLHDDLAPELLGAELKFVSLFEKMANSSFTTLIGALAFYMGQQFPDKEIDDTLRKKEDGKS